MTDHSEALLAQLDAEAASITTTDQATSFLDKIGGLTAALHSARWPTPSHRLVADAARRFGEEPPPAYDGGDDTHDWLDVLARHTNAHVTGPPCDTSLPGGHRLLARVTDEDQGDALRVMLTEANPTIRPFGEVRALVWPNSTRLLFTTTATPEVLRDGSSGFCRVIDARPTT